MESRPLPEPPGPDGLPPAGVTSPSQLRQLLAEQRYLSHVGLATTCFRALSPHRPLFLAAAPDSAAPEWLSTAAGAAAGARRRHGGLRRTGLPDDVDTPEDLAALAGRVLPREEQACS
ncbi:MAG TPA: hypothetical protein VG452_10675 [Egibacteraceae bacterium]|nr:hypothetical protein [Egibacteraceae bacterium]